MCSLLQDPSASRKPFGNHASSSWFHRRKDRCSRQTACSAASFASSASDDSENRDSAAAGEWRREEGGDSLAAYQGDLER